MIFCGRYILIDLRIGFNATIGCMHPEILVRSPNLREKSTTSMYQSRSQACSLLSLICLDHHPSKHTVSLYNVKWHKLRFPISKSSEVSANSTDTCSHLMQIAGFAPNRLYKYDKPRVHLHLHLGSLQNHV